MNPSSMLSEQRKIEKRDTVLDIGGLSTPIFLALSRQLWCKQNVLWGLYVTKTSVIISPLIPKEVDHPQDLPFSFRQQSEGPDPAIVHPTDDFKARTPAIHSDTHMTAQSF